MANEREPDSAALDVLIVGAGFAGIAALHRFRDVDGHSVRLIEAAEGAGGA